MIFSTFIVRRFCLMVVSTLTLLTMVKAQCPEIQAMLVDACGTEHWNEFVIIHSGSAGFNTNNITVDFPVGNNSMSAQNNDINTNVDNFPPGTPCGLTTGNPAAFTGCSNIIAIGPGFNVPPNQIVIFQFSSMSTNGLYDFSSLCGMDQCVYVIANSCIRTIGGMTNNNPSGPRTTNFDFGGGCTQSPTYNTNLIPNAGGAYYLPASDTYGSFGCIAPPSGPAPAPTTPIFTIDNMYCVGEAPDVLPNTSDNGITGTWSPTSINTSMPGNFMYTFTPSVGQCAVPFTLMVTVTMNTPPDFTIDNDYCQNDVPDVLPMVSNNGVTGSWSPAMINTSTPGSTNYTFTPDPDQCASVFVLMVTVTAQTVPAFTIEDEYCVGDSPDALPNMSNNGISGTWAPATINTSTAGMTSYTFTPTAGQCATIFTLNVTVEANVIPNFSFDNVYCLNEVPDVLPNISNNGVPGTWNPSVITTNSPGSTNYTFTPNAGECASVVVISVLVNPLTSPTFSPFGDICENDSPPGLPNVSNNGISGTWSPAVINTSSPGTQNYIFNPNPNQCAVPVAIPITVLPRPHGAIQGNVNICPGQCGDIAFTLSGGSGTYNLNMQITIGAFNTPFAIPGASVNTMLTICYNGTDFFPQFQAPSTLILPQNTPPGTITLSLISLNDAAGGSCSAGIVDNGSMSITLLPGPDAFDASLSVCDENSDGIGVFDLNNAQDDVTGNNPLVTVRWFQDILLMNEILNPSGFMATDGTIIYALVEDASGCTDMAVVTLELIIPQLVNLPVFTVCVTDPPIILPNPVNGVSGNWSDVDGNVSGNQFDPSGLPEGNYTITFTPVAGQCFVAGNTTVTVTSGGPIPLIGIEDELCEGFGIYTLPDMPNGVSGDWSSSTPFLNGNDFDATAAGVGSYIFTFTPDDPNSCFLPNSITIDVINNEDLQPPGLPDVCENFGLFTLPVPVAGESGDWGGSPHISGNLFNAMVGPGVYSITFFPDNVCKNDLVMTLTIIEAVDPNFTPYPMLCSDSPPINLPSSVDGILGNWSLNGNIISVFNPVVTGNGSFTLTFTPNPDLCANGFNTVIVVGSVHSGEDRDTSFCLSGTLLVDLNSFLSVDAQSGGVWFANAMVVMDPLNFELNTLPSGNNTLWYVLEDALCGNDTAFIQVNLQSPPNAGPDMNLVLCQTQTNQVDITAVMGSFDPGGIWSNNRNISIDFSDPTDVDMSPLPAGVTTFLHSFPEQICPGDTATLNVRIDSSYMAGPDIMTLACTGSIIDLSTLIQPAFGGGTFVDINLYGGLTGNMWDASGQADGDFAFLYVTTPNGACIGDTALVEINLQSVLSAGDDVIAEYCDGQGFLPADLLPANASPGGKLYFETFLVPINTPIFGNLIEYTFLYITGDGITCPFDTAVWTIERVDKPLINFTMNDITLCEGDCKEIRIVHTSNAVREIGLLRIASVSNQDHFRIDSLIPGQDLVLEICNDSTQVGSFYNLGGVTFPLSNYFVTYFKERSCEYKLTAVGSYVWTLESPKITINETLCIGESLTIGSVTFDENNPSGTSLVPGVGDDCDSLFTVNLSFTPEARGSFSQSTCNPNFSVTIGNQIFNSNNPSGTAIIQGGSFFGCDSIVDVNLTFLPPIQNVIEEITCDPNFTVTVGNTTFNRNIPSGQITLFGSAANGCDSIVTVDLTFLNPSNSSLDTTLCDQTFTLMVGNTVFSNINPSGQVVLSNAAANGCDSIVNVNLTFQNFAPDVQTSIPACGESIGSIAFLSANAPGPFNVWTNGIQTETGVVLPFEKPLNPGLYDIILESSDGCRIEYMVDIPDNSRPDITLDSINNDQMYTLTLEGGVDSIFNIQWSPASIFDCSDCISVDATINQNTTGNVTYEYGDGCIENIPFLLIFTPAGTFEVPNVIKVGSGPNGRFFISKPDNFNGAVVSMDIYDRWGEKVFSKTNVNWDDPSSGWDGTFSGREVIPGVYVYRVEILDFSSTARIVLQGDLTVLR